MSQPVARGMIHAIHRVEHFEISGFAPSKLDDWPSVREQLVKSQDERGWILSPIEWGNRDPPESTPRDFPKNYDHSSQPGSTPSPYRLSAICQPIAG
jgi:hypothetical protein